MKHYCQLPNWFTGTSGEPLKYGILFCCWSVWVRSFIDSDLLDTDNIVPFEVENTTPINQNKRTKFLKKRRADWSYCKKLIFAILLCHERNLHLQMRITSLFARCASVRWWSADEKSESCCGPDESIISTCRDIDLSRLWPICNRVWSQIIMSATCLWLVYDLQKMSKTLSRFSAR